MTKGVTTMTTRPSRTTVLESALAGGYQFVSSPDVSALSVGCERDPMGTSFDSALGACVEEVRRRVRSWKVLLPAHRLLLLAATPFWANAGAVQRRRGIWGSDEMKWLASGGSRSKDVEIRRDDGIRFAGLAEIADDSLLEAAQYVRVNESGVLFFSRGIGTSDIDVQETFALAFPKGGVGADWRSLTSHFATSDDAGIRVVGGFDDREVSVDVFMSSRMRKLVA
jgi:hypothetical protein